MVNMFIVENGSQIVHIEDHFMFYNSKLSKGPDTNAGQTQMFTNRGVRQSINVDAKQ